MVSNRLDASFFNRSPLIVARELLGQRLVRILDGQRLAGLINEIEAYDGEDDLACHARAGLTPRTKIMYGSPGYAYVYFTYGMHWLLNFVTGPDYFPSAVLLRGLTVVEGLPIIANQCRNRPPSEWTNGPAKICQAFNINGDLNGHWLCGEQSELWIEQEPQIADEQVITTPRIGISHVPEPWKSKPWRFVANLRL